MWPRLPIRHFACFLDKRHARMRQAAQMHSWASGCTKPQQAARRCVCLMTGTNSRMRAQSSNTNKQPIPSRRIRPVQQVPDGPRLFHPHPCRPSKHAVPSPMSIFRLEVRPPCTSNSKARMPRITPCGGTISNSRSWVAIASLTRWIPSTNAFLGFV